MTDNEYKRENDDLMRLLTKNHSEFEKHNDLNVQYRDYDPNKQRMVTITPEIAKNAIKEYVENEFGIFIDNEFKLTNKNIDDKLFDLKTQLLKYVDNKIDKIVEEIISETTKNKISEKVNNKLK